MSEKPKPLPAETGATVPSRASPRNGPAASDFGLSQTPEDLAAEQGVQPVEDFDKFLEEIGDVWPEDETADEFIAWLRRTRREGKGTV